MITRWVEFYFKMLHIFDLAVGFVNYIREFACTCLRYTPRPKSEPELDVV